MSAVYLAVPAKHGKDLSKEPKVAIKCINKDHVGHK